MMPAASDNQPRAAKFDEDCSNVRLALYVVGTTGRLMVPVPQVQGRLLLRLPGTRGHRRLGRGRALVLVPELRPLLDFI